MPDIDTLIEDWRRAEATNDGEALADLLTEDFVGIGPRGWRRTRDQWADRYRTGTVVNESLELSELDVRVHGDAAFAVAVQQQRGTNGGTDTTGRFRVTLSAMRRTDGWRIAGLHVGPLLP